jgi:hypothetical protein
MNHRQAIHQLRTAGWHDDKQRLKTLLATSKVSPPLATQAFKDGRKLRVNGVRCGCNICVPKSSK